MVANCLLTRCPNQYGVFDFPLGFILRFFHGIFCQMEIEGFMQEWEAAGFVKFYKDRSVIWIKSKWKRAGKPNENHWKGLETHLQAYPEVRKDFIIAYGPHWGGIESPSKGDTHPHRNSESESESESEPEGKKKTLPPVDGVSQPVKPKKKYVPIEDRPAKTATSRLVRSWHRIFLKVHGTGYSGDIVKISGQMKRALRKNDEATILDAMQYLFALSQTDYIRHDFDHFIRKLSYYIIEKDREGK